MISLLIGADSRLTHCDIRVYLMLTCHRRGAFVSIGERRIASLIHIKRRTARNSIEKLIAQGYVERESVGHGGRARYRLTDPLFAGKYGASVPSEPAIPPASAHQDRQTAAVICPKCHRSCRQILKVGYCRACRWDAKVRRLAREEIAKTEVA